MQNKKDGSTNLWLPMMQNNPKTESLTPHKVATVFLVRAYLELKLADALAAGDKKRFLLVLMKLIQHSDLSYRELFGLLISEKYCLNAAHLERFQKVMETICTTDNGIESLFDLQTDVDRLMSETPDKNGGVCQFGPVGLYLRRVHVTLDKMSFSEVLNLYKSIKRYYETGTRAAAIAPTNSGELKLANKDRNVCKWSIKQAELFVSQQSNLLLNDETEAMHPSEMQAKLCEIMQDNPLFSQAYFLCYMNSVRLRDYFNATDALMRAFDRSTLKSLTMATSTENKGYQYSSLNLAILHAQFGHRDEAVKCLKECIMLSQEAGDRTCLDLAQSWYCYLRAKENYPHSEVSGKSDLSVAMNASVAIQSLVEKSATNGSKPAKLFEMLLKSDTLNCQHSLLHLMSIGLAERSALWSLYGKNEIASACSQVLLSANLQKLGKMYNSDGICEAICTNALWLGLQGEYTMSATILQHAKERFPRYPMSQYWILTDAYITSIQCSFLSRWQEAEDAISTLRRIDEPLATLQLASLHIFKRNSYLAQKLLYDLLDGHQTLAPLIRVRALILLANTMIKPQNVEPEAMNVLNKAMTIAKDKFLSYEIALINAHFAKILLFYGMQQRALKCIKAALEPVLSNGGLYDKAKVQFLAIRCIVACCKTNLEIAQKLKDCQTLINEAEQSFLKLEAYAKLQDLYAFIGEKWHECHNYDARNQVSYKFRKIYQQFPVTKEYFNVFY